MLRIFLIALSIALLWATEAEAGGGPETTLLVVNGRSPNSRRVANHYVSLRGLPASHVLYLEDVPHDGVIKLAQFREKIWAPIEAYLKSAGLAGQIDLITYSVDFPYAVDFKSKLGEGRPGQAVGGQASLTGVTYLIRQVEADQPFWELMRGGQNPTQTNRYSRFAWGGTSSTEKPLTSEDREIFRKAAMALRKGDPATAAKAYAEFVKRAPQIGRAWTELALSLVQLKRYDDALDALERAARNGFAEPGRVDAQDGFAPLRRFERYRQILQRMRSTMPGLRSTRGFRASFAWGADGEPVEEDENAHRYFLSTQLGYTGFVGNSYREVYDYLTSAAGADATNPDGTVYICKNGNVRSTARQQFFGPLVGALKARGRKVVVLENAKVPTGKNDVIGAVVGTAGFNWGASKSKILPGAICEHLTSFGAHFGTTSQTKVSEFMRFGAAGSSGTVMEPLALHLKFPNPLIHVFYADGCTLAEAYYQSVHGPYQLMVVGDGLCQPFAKKAEFKVKGPAAPWKGEVTFRPEGAPGNYELWVDGKRVSTGDTLEWDTPRFRDGWHDVRVVHVTADLLEMRTSRTVEGYVSNQRDVPTVATDKRVVPFGESIRLRVGGLKKYEVWCGGRKVADGPVVDSALVGPGPVRLQVRSKVAQTEPLDITIVPPAMLPASKLGGSRELGLEATIDGTANAIVTSLATRAAGVRLQDQLSAYKRAKSIELRGAIEVLGDGLHQLNITGGGTVTIRVGGKELCTKVLLDRQLYVPVGLAKGWHTLEIDYSPRGVPQLEVMVTGDHRATAPRLGRLLPNAPKPEWKAGKKGVFELTWKKTPKKGISGIAVLPEKGAILPTEWTVEWRRGKFGKFKKLKTVVVSAPQSVKAPRPKKGEKAKPRGPLAIELQFDPVKARQMRLVPKTPAKISGVLVTRVG